MMHSTTDISLDTDLKHMNYMTYILVSVYKINTQIEPDMAPRLPPGNAPDFVSVQICS